MAGENISMRAHYARRITRQRLSAELNELRRKHGYRGPNDKHSYLSPEGDGVWGIDDLPAAPPLKAKDPKDVKLKICIIGAGMAGLRSAKLLDMLKEKYPGVSYEILEASERVGGRVYTHYFSDAKHDYYDIGAMRFPDIPTMKPVFDLFTYYNLPKIPYYLSKGSVNTPSCFNDRTVYDVDWKNDPFGYSTKNGGKVPEYAVKKGPDDIVAGFFGPFKEQLYEDFPAGFKTLQKHDDYTTRDYLRFTPFQDFFTMQWLETFESATGLYDQAFTESVIDSFDFDNEPEPDWYCIDGGTSLLAKAMEDDVSSKPERGKKVTAISLNREPGSMSVTVHGEDKPREYDAVICTAPLGCAQRMDLRGCELHPQLKDAIRSLHYDSSSKVGIKFSKPWWINEPFNINKGGVGSTDLPIRTCVYPSYNLSDGADNPAVLLASYTWAQDAMRIGSLVRPESPKGEEELKELVLRDLARLHAKKPEDVDPLYEKIKNLYITHHAFDFYQDPYTSGAFALFGPGQFQNYFPLLTRPHADSRLFFAGEATSAHHAWIIGALDSAVRAIKQIGRSFSLDTSDLNKEIRIPGEIDEDVILPLQVAMGELKRSEQVRV